jgi:hypothetical protein
MSATSGDLGDQAQMAGDELVRRLAVAVLAPALGQHVLFLRFQHREPSDLFQITGQAGFGRHAPIRGRPPNHDFHRIAGDEMSSLSLQLLSKPNYRHLTSLSI